MKLFKPVGFEELTRMYNDNMRSYALHPDHQPTFSLAPNIDFAIRVARVWKTKSEPYAGYVTECEVADDYGKTFPARQALKKSDKESWIMPDELEEFNKHIKGSIKVASGYFGPQFRGNVPEHFNFAGRDALAQFVMLSYLLNFSRMDFIGEVHANSLAVFLHFPYWEICDLDKTEISDDQRLKVLDSIEKIWSKELPELPRLSSEGNGPAT